MVTSAHPASDTNFETLEVSNEGAVRTIHLNRPNALNAFSSLLMDELCDAFLAAADADRVKVLVLTGAGRAFSAGADLTEMGRSRRESRHGFDGLLEAIIDFPKPFIVAVNGVGAGIGATICGLADFCFIADEARLRCPFSTLGLTAEAASTYTFPMLMGRQRAAWFLMSAEWMSGPECEQAGLALKSVPLEQLMSTAMTHANTLAALPIASLIKTKSLIMAPHREQMLLSCKAENQGLADLLGGPANREALTAFAEKREPDFSSI